MKDLFVMVHLPAQQASVNDIDYRVLQISDGFDL